MGSYNYTYKYTIYNNLSTTLADNAAIGESYHNNIFTPESVANTGKCTIGILEHVRFGWG